MFISSILNSYSQIFFSDKKIFGIILLLVTFMDIYTGIGGIAAVLIANVIAKLLNYNTLTIQSGYYSFNALLVGLGVATEFEPSIPLYFLLFFATVLTLLITWTCEGIFYKYNLPFLSIPFLIVMAIISLSSRNLEALELSERGIFFSNELQNIGGKTLVDAYKFLDSTIPFRSLKSYFLSLGAIFFQYHLIAGIIIAFGLLIYSRMAFVLSLLGFYIAYSFYKIGGADFTQLSYNYIGFNYILTSIALGGIFIIPSKISFATNIFTLPLVAIITLASERIFAIYQLPIYSLPFNVVVLLVIYSLKIRPIISKRLILTQVQLSSPEKNLYFYQNSISRYQNSHYFHFFLPFFGEWTISQGQNGKDTHKDEWKFAFDFMITDAQNKPFRNAGREVSDYYCYEKPILAPANGVVVKIVDGIPDNLVGNRNLSQNWGNTLIIKHSEYLYSKLSHLKAGSFKVSEGDFVYKGKPLALCGNSGNSPYPHLHFQVQSFAYVGATTLDYPFSYYISREKNVTEWQYFARPREKEVVSNIEVSQFLKKTFTFFVGQQIMFTFVKGKILKFVKFQVKVDMLNRTFLYCSESKSVAYFFNDGNVLFFTNFYGNKKSWLYKFVLAVYKVQFSFHKNLKINDLLPINELFPKGILFFYDFISPFFSFLKTKFSLEYCEVDNELSPSKMILSSKISNCVGKFEVNSFDFIITIDRSGISEICVF